MSKDKNTDERATTEEDTARSEAPADAGAERETIEELKERLAQKEAEAAEYLERLRRQQAETENFRKRMLREQAYIVECAAEAVILELLPLVDNLERALEAAKEHEQATKLHEGVKLIAQQLHGILEKQCVKAIDPVGHEFDPMQHQAVMQVESGEHGENTVVEVIQKGYQLKEKLLRPAMVKVSK